MLKLGALVAELIPGVGTALEIERMVKDPSQRTVTNVALLIAGLLPVFRAAKGGKKVVGFLKRTSANWKRRSPARRPTKVPGQQKQAVQARSGKNKPDRRQYSPGEARRLISRQLEFLLDSTIATFWELLEQHFGGQPNIPRAGIQGISGGLSEFLNNPDDTVKAALSKEIGLVFSTQLLSLMTEDNGLDMSEDWRSIALVTTEAGLIALSTGIVRKTMDRTARNHPAGRKVVSYFKQPIATAIEFGVSTVFRKITGQEDRSGVENTSSVISLMPGRR